MTHRARGLGDKFATTMQMTRTDQVGDYVLVQN